MYLKVGSEIQSIVFYRRGKKSWGAGIGEKMSWEGAEMQLFINQRAFENGD